MTRALLSLAAVAVLLLSARAGHSQSQQCKSKKNVKSRVKDIKKSKIDYPTGDKKFSVLEAFPSPFNAVEEVDPFLICHEWGDSKKAMGTRAVDPGKPKSKQEKHVG